MLLIATFRLTLPDGSLLVVRPFPTDFRFRFRIDEFDAELFLDHSPNEVPRPVTIPIKRVQVILGREEEIQPPALKAKQGENNFEEIRVYFAERTPAYRKAAQTVLNRLILYFKYVLRNPQLRLLHEYEQDLQNPTWTDDEGHEFPINEMSYVVHSPPTPGVLGVRVFTPNQESELQAALQTPITPELFQELVSDAQDSAFDGNFPMSALELTIACEVLVKQSFFGKATAASSAFEYLEDRNRANVRIIDLIDGAAKHAFGVSFKDSDPNDFSNIDFLFRCRNKIAHRGTATYRDDSGHSHNLDSKTLAQWWESVEKLAGWLSKQRT